MIETGGETELAAPNVGTGYRGNGEASRKVSLAKLEVPAEVLRALPAEFARRHLVLPFRLENGSIDVATAEPGNQRVRLQPP